MHQSRWGYHPCSYTTFLQLKELTKLAFVARRHLATYERWARKKPSNRVARAILCNATGQKIGYGPSTPIPQPPKPQLPFSIAKMETAYRLARIPHATQELVKPLPFSEVEIDKWHAELCSGGGHGK
jgi:hypothetical protein